jgi:hypothetical protein
MGTNRGTLLGRSRSPLGCCTAEVDRNSFFTNHSDTVAVTNMASVQNFVVVSDTLT